MEYYNVQSKIVTKDYGKLNVFLMIHPKLEKISADRLLHLIKDIHYVSGKKVAICFFDKEKPITFEDNLLGKPYTLMPHSKEKNGENLQQSIQYVTKEVLSMLANQKDSVGLATDASVDIRGIGLLFIDSKTCDLMFHPFLSASVAEGRIGKKYFKELFQMLYNKNCELHPDSLKIIEKHLKKWNTKDDNFSQFHLAKAINLSDVKLLNLKATILEPFCVHLTRDHEKLECSK